MGTYSFDLANPQLAHVLADRLTAMQRATLLQTARQLAGYAHIDCKDVTATEQYGAVARWENDHSSPCGWQVVSELHALAPRCLLSLQHPFEGVTEFPGRSGVPSSPLAMRALARIRRFDQTGHAELDDLLVVHRHNAFTLRQLNVQHIQTLGINAPWKMDAQRLAAIVACPKVWTVSLTHCDLRGGWLDRLVAEMPAGGPFLSTYRVLELYSGCIYSDDGTLHLAGSIPVMRLGVCPHTVKLSWAEAIPHKAFCGFATTTAVELPPNLVKIGPHAFADCAALQGVRFTHCPPPLAAPLVQVAVPCPAPACPALACPPRVGPASSPGPPRVGPASSPGVSHAPRPLVELPGSAPVVGPRVPAPSARFGFPLTPSGCVAAACACRSAPQ